jgi:aerobic-type carbon monoxide dehydrogenase small subunit (CoxS/CutS family)
MLASLSNERHADGPSPAPLLRKARNSLTCVLRRRYASGRRRALFDSRYPFKTSNNPSAIHDTSATIPSAPHHRLSSAERTTAQRHRASARHASRLAARGRRPYRHQERLQRGACGTCTVLVDGKRMNSCLTLVVQCDGADVTTVEGIARADGTLHPVQQAFIDHDAFQCGYCTPGQIVSAVACIAEGHAADETSVREWMSGNLCRCSCYPQITAAVLDAAKRVGARL